MLLETWPRLVAAPVAGHKQVFDRRPMPSPRARRWPRSVQRRGFSYRVAAVAMRAALAPAWPVHPHPRRPKTLTASSASRATADYT